MSPLSYALKEKITPEEVARSGEKLGKQPHLGKTVKALKELGGFGSPAPSNAAIAAMLYNIPRTSDGAEIKDQTGWADNRFKAILYGKEKGSVSPREAEFLYAGFQRTFGPAAARISRQAFLKTPIDQLIKKMNLDADQDFWRALDPSQALALLANQASNGLTLTISPLAARWEPGADGREAVFEDDNRAVLSPGEEFFLEITGLPRRSAPPLALLISDRPGVVNGAPIRAQTLARVDREGSAWRVSRNGVEPLKLGSARGDFAFVAVAGSVDPIPQDLDLPLGVLRRLDKGALQALVERVRRDQSTKRVSLAILPFRVA